MNEKTKKIVDSIARTPGVYFFKNKDGIILYIGKAKNLNDRVKSYFAQQPHDWKLAGLLSEFETIETVKTHNEIEALLLEAELIKIHKPKYNTLLKEGNPFVYILKTDEPVADLQIVRTKKQKGLYFGPFLQKKEARSVVAFLKDSFTLNRCNKKIENGCLDYHLGRCAGTCKRDFDTEGYNIRMELAVNVLKNDKNAFIDTLKTHIKQYSVDLAFEKARNLQKYLEGLEVIFNTIKTKFSVEKYESELIRILYPQELGEGSTQINLQLQTFLKTEKPIRTIDCFDISHMQGQDIVGSCVRFTDGRPDKNKFRKFRLKTVTQQNDYAALQEIVIRRYKDKTEIPDLVVIDGGKGQLSAVKQILPDALIISLAKREERIFGSWDPDGIRLDLHDPVGKLLIALRDYTHHFAISFHRLRRKNSIKE
ncbi:GIY-YIG nuclease family protein [bacterium]|nr:MAG: GIY-YIG nuclease family protein [bacterium]QQR61429.1 MAG: GIY-YIG nuclease family protein [bacterium]QQR63049.1 MAG: GIY-YIG nuclease family protein [bacterium]